MSKIPDLHKLIGTYHTDNLLNHPKVKPQLIELMGPDLPILFNNLLVRGPIDLIGCSIVVSGIAPHRGSDENGIFSINLLSGNIHAALKSEKFKGQIIIYGNKAWGSSGIRDWVYHTYFSESPVKVIYSSRDYKKN